MWDPATSPSRELKQGNDNIIYGLGPLYVVKADTTTLTFARDGGRNVRAELNAAGAATAAFRYRSYGQLAQSTSAGPAYLGLASQLPDPSSLYYMLARWYDAAMGRFVTRDPARGAPLFRRVSTPMHTRTRIRRSPSIQVGLLPRPVMTAGASATSNASIRFRSRQTSRAVRSVQTCLPHRRCRPHVTQCSHFRMRHDPII